jgi:hypothetical protein
VALHTHCFARIAELRTRDGEPHRVADRAETLEWMGCVRGSLRGTLRATTNSGKKRQKASSAKLRGRSAGGLDRLCHYRRRLLKRAAEAQLVCSRPQQRMGAIGYAARLVATAPRFGDCSPFEHRSVSSLGRCRLAGLRQLLHLPARREALHNGRTADPALPAWSKYCTASPSRLRLSEAGMRRSTKWCFDLQQRPPPAGASRRPLQVVCDGSALMLPRSCPVLQPRSTCRVVPLAAAVIPPQRSRRTTVVQPVGSPPSLAAACLAARGLWPAASSAAAWAPAWCWRHDCSPVDRCVGVSHEPAAAAGVITVSCGCNDLQSCQRRRDRCRGQLAALQRNLDSPSATATGSAGAAGIFELLLLCSRALHRHVHVTTAAFSRSLG